MHSLIASLNHPSSLPRSTEDLKFLPFSSSPVVVFNPRASRFCAGLRSSFKFGDLRRREPVSKVCKGWNHEEGNSALEAEILEFMKNSKKPNAFPTKEELNDAGRKDLAEAVIKQGGWLSIGWDLDDVEEDDARVRDDEFHVRETEAAAYLQKIERNYECGHEVHSVSSEVLEAKPLPTTSSTCGSSELENEEDSGIHGILKRLEKQRNLAFGVNLAKNTSSEEHVDNCGYPSPGNGIQEDTVNLEESNRNVQSRNLELSISDNCNGDITQKGDSSRNSPDSAPSWRTWSMQRATISNAEFEVGEISSWRDQLQGGDFQKKDDNIFAIPENVNGSAYLQKSITLNEVQTRLQELDLELSSTIQSFKSNSKQVDSHKEGKASSHEWQDLSDALEFQENEIMKANDQLRSLRSKLVVLEGKMAFALFDSQKLMHERRKKIDGMLKAAEMIRHTCVLWPNFASEVYLTGSFDGWTSQRKMEVSKSGIFSLWLKLYPGKYEIKFIVDGQWKVDPLRPTVVNGGHENNLLFV